MTARLTTWFFRNFFHFLLGLVCVSQWSTLWWLIAPGPGWPLWLHAAGIVAFWVVNARLAQGAGRFGRKPPSPNAFLRFYFAAAFASVFCFVFLALANTARAILAALDALLQASTSLAVPLPSDDGFTTFVRIGIAGIALTFVYGYTIGQRRLRVRSIDIPVPSLARELADFRIAHITDIHMGQNLDPEQLAAYVERVNQLDADLICVTGDMIDSPRTDMDLFLPIFAKLRARHGVYVILGNHDHSAGAERVVAAFRRHTAFILLRDTHRPVQVGDAALHIIGMDDRGLDWARGLRRDAHLETLFGQVPAEAPVVLLNHRPDLFDHAATLGIVLTLSGHTHGGQIAMPWITGRYLNPSRFITPFDRGLYERNGCYLYTNCGLGVTSQRVRICTPREIAVFRLCRREAP